MPMIMSGCALLLSACSLLVSLQPSSPASAATAEQPAAAAAVSHSGQQVWLDGLVVQHGAIAAGAVGTTALADEAVTDAKIAPGTITESRLSHDAITTIAKSVSQGRSLVGEVDESGSVVRGGRFSASHLATGEYELTFNEPFLKPPVVVAVAQSYGTCYLPAQTISASSVRIKCLSDLLGSTPMPANTRFSFYASPAF